MLCDKCNWPIPERHNRCARCRGGYSDRAVIDTPRHEGKDRGACRECGVEVLKNVRNTYHGFLCSACKLKRAYEYGRAYRERKKNIQ